jgi:hypothetical protein
VTNLLSSGHISFCFPAFHSRGERKSENGEKYVKPLSPLLVECGKRRNQHFNEKKIKADYASSDFLCHAIITNYFANFSAPREKKEVIISSGA